MGPEKAEKVKNKLSFIASQKIGDKNPFYGKSHNAKSIKLIRKSAIGRKPGNLLIIEIEGIQYEGYKRAELSIGIKSTTIR